MDSDIAGKTVGQNSNQLFSGHWPADDEWIHLIVASIVNMTILSIVNAAMAVLADGSWKIQELWGSQEEPNRECGPPVHNGTPILNRDSAAGCVKMAIKLNHTSLFCIVYHGQQADDTSGAQALMCGGSSYVT